jgi:hypothetical protein
VVARGAAGAGQSGSYNGYYENFGRGGRVYAVIPVKPGEKLHVFVGGQGSTTGGFNGGGNPGSTPQQRGATCYGGGGASDVRDGMHGLRDRIVVAAGGGGQGCGFFNTYDGYFVFGGQGGPAVGEAGGAWPSGDSTAGGGGTQNKGGAGGIGGGSASGEGGSGQSGTLGHGGNGGSGGLDPYCNRSNYHCIGGNGGGGGGGYYGGGGGGGGASYDDYGFTGDGGGGGSSYVEPYATKVRLWRGWKNANTDGLVVFSWK